jgi:hypothetical protein
MRRFFSRQCHENYVVPVGAPPWKIREASIFHIFILTREYRVTFRSVVVPRAISQ